MARLKFWNSRTLRLSTLAVLTCLAASVASASEFSAIVRGSAVWGHDIQYATIDHLNGICSGIGGGASSAELPAEAEEQFRRELQYARERGPGLECSSSAIRSLTVPCASPCSGSSSDALDALVNSPIVVRGIVYGMTPGYDFLSGRAITVVSIDATEVFPPGAAGRAAQVRFVLPWGSFSCGGIEICTKPSFSALSGFYELELGTDVFISGSRYQPGGKFIDVPLARIFKVINEVAEPLSFVDIYSPEAFSVSEARTRLQARAD